MEAKEEEKEKEYEAEEGEEKSSGPCYGFVVRRDPVWHPPVDLSEAILCVDLQKTIGDHNLVQWFLLRSLRIATTDRNNKINGLTSATVIASTST